jgi:hypothetical protein
MNKQELKGDCENARESWCTCFMRSICPLYLSTLSHIFNAGSGRGREVLRFTPQIRVLLFLGIQLHFFDAGLQRVYFDL